MILINLQPAYRSIGKKENIISQLIIFVIVLCIVIGICIFIDNSTISTIEGLEIKNTQTRTKILNYKKRSKDVDRLKKELDKVNKRLEIIEKLASNRTGSINILNNLTDSLVAKRMWLTNVKANEFELQLIGIALDDKTVSDFMRNLEEARDTFKVNDSLLNKLKNENVQHEILTKIKNLGTYPYLHKAKFIAALKTVIGDDYSVELEKTIVKNATMFLFKRIILNKTELTSIEDKINLKKFDILCKLKEVSIPKKGKKR